MSKYTIKLSQQRENEGEPFSTEDKGSAVRYFERLRVPVGQRKLLYEGNNIVVTSTCVDEKGGEPIWRHRYNTDAGYDESWMVGTELSPSMSEADTVKGDPFSKAKERHQRQREQGRRE